MYILQGTKTLGFICHPKTGSQSVRVLMKQMKAKDEAGHHHVPYVECRRIRANGGEVACVVRNPYDVMVSWYHYSHVKPNLRFNKPIQTFSAWIPGFLEEGNSWVEKGLFYGAQFCTKILRFGPDLSKDFSELLLDCGHPGAILEVHNESENRLHYRAYYDKAARGLVTDYCQYELRTFGYEF